MEFLNPFVIHALCFSFLTLFCLEGMICYEPVTFSLEIKYNMFGYLYMHRHSSNMLSINVAVVGVLEGFEI